MNQEAKHTLSKVGELVANDKTTPKKKYLRVKEAVLVYPMSRTKLTEEALKCGALYEVGKVKLINIYILDLITNKIHHLIITVLNLVINRIYSNCRIRFYPNIIRRSLIKNFSKFGIFSGKIIFKIM